MRVSLPVVLALAACLPSQAFAATCVTPAEAEALIQVLLPDTVVAVTEKCRSLVADGAFLPRSGAALAQRWRPAAEAAWPTARSAVGKVTDPTLARLIGDDAGRKLITGTVVEGFAKDLKASDCTTVDRLLGAVEALPARNVAVIIETILEASDKDKKKGSASPAICPRQGDRR